MRVRTVVNSLFVSPDNTRGRVGAQSWPYLPRPPTDRPKRGALGGLECHSRDRHASRRSQLDRSGCKHKRVQSYIRTNAIVRATVRMYFTLMCGKRQTSVTRNQLTRVRRYCNEPVRSRTFRQGLETTEKWFSRSYRRCRRALRRRLRGRCSIVTIRGTVGGRAENWRNRRCLRANIRDSATY